MKVVKFLQKNWQKATVATGLVLASGYANAADPISTLLDGVDIHGITVAKRVINKM